MDNELHQKWVLAYIEDEADHLSDNHKWEKVVFLVIFYLNAKCLVWYFIYHSKYLIVRQPLMF